MLGNTFPGQQLRLERIQFPVECLPVVRTLVGVEVKMQVQASFSADRVALVRPFLLVVPGYSLAEYVQLEVAVVVFIMILTGSDLSDIVLYKAECGSRTAQKLQMLLIQSIDVADAVEAPVHDEFDLFIA